VKINKSGAGGRKVIIIPGNIAQVIEKVKKN
jgi:hypothetical protein